MWEVTKAWTSVAADSELNPVIAGHVTVAGADKNRLNRPERCAYPWSDLMTMSPRALKCRCYETSVSVKKGRKLSQNNNFLDHSVYYCFMLLTYYTAALAEGSIADCIKTGSPRVQVSTRVCISIGLPYWRALSGGRCRGSSATPFQFIFIIDCQPHPTPYRRWPSFLGRRCTCLEQSARSCHFRTFRSSLPVPA